MQLRYRQQVTAAGISVVALALTLGACSSSSSSSPPSGSSSSSSSSGGSANLSGTPNPSGSTFQLTSQQEALAAFNTIHPNITINYAGGGSAHGPPPTTTGPCST